MAPPDVDVLLLRELFPDLTLREGMTLPARVLRYEGEQAVVRLAGALVETRLPPGIEPGTDLRLEVRSIGPERVELRIARPPRGPSGDGAVDVLA